MYLRKWWTFTDIFRPWIIHWISFLLRPDQELFTDVLWLVIICDIDMKCHHHLDVNFSGSNLIGKCCEITRNVQRTYQIISGDETFEMRGIHYDMKGEIMITRSRIKAIIRYTPNRYNTTTINGADVKYYESYNLHTQLLWILQLMFAVSQWCTLLLSFDILHPW